MMIMARRCALSVFCAAMTVSLLLTGCGDRKQERKYRCLPGVAKSIDLATNRVSMEFTRPEKGDVIELDGLVTPETEIIINGRVAKLEDIKVGEDVEVTGYKTGEGTDARMVVVKVVIERPEAVTTGQKQPVSKPTTKPTAKPTTQPTTKPAK